MTTHGSFFSMAHFHYTIMGGLLFTFFAGIYYWVPKMTGYKFDERLGKWHFWVMFISFNSTFGPLLVIGFLGMPRRVVTYAGYLQGANVWVSISAFVLGGSMLIFLANFVWSQVFARVPDRDEPVGIEVDRVAAALAGPVHNFDAHSDVRLGPVSLRRRRGRIVAAARRRAREADAMSELASHSTDYSVVEREPPGVMARQPARRARSSGRARRCSSSSRSSSPTSTFAR